MVNLTEQFDVIKKNYKSLWTDLIEWKESIKLSSVFDFLIHRKFVIFSISVLLVLGLKSQFESLLNALLVDSIYKEIKFNIGFDFVFLLFTLIIITFLAKKASKFYRASFTEVCLSIGLVLTYSYYRIGDNVWDFEPFRIEMLSFLAYLDLLLLPTFYPILILISFHLFQYTSSGIGNLFLEDIPISKNRNDILNRKPLAIELAQKVVDQKFKKSFSIGILGKWGTGKSSFMSLIQDEISYIKPNALIINFNAFYNHDAKDIIKEFFTILSIEISVYSGALSSNIIIYRDYLINLISSNSIKNIKGLLTLLASEKEQSVFAQYKKVNDALKKLDKQVLIFIDDLDRLRHTEIIEILKIIRNTGDFSNTVYFVAFDKNYITKSLEDHSSYSDDKFIQKYFQYEFVLPPIKKELLRKRFIDIISNRIEDSSLTAEGTIINPEKYVSSTIFDSQIQTMRDVTRLANNYCFEYQRVSGEVDVDDFTKLMILKSKFASVYETISHNKQVYIDFHGNELKWQEEKGKKLISNYLEESKLFSTVDITEIDELLESLFPDSIVNSEPNHLSIRHPKNIDKYFYLDLLSGDISNVEFIKSFNSDFSRFDKSISKWIKEEKHYLVINRISSEPLDSKIKIFNAIQGLIHIAKSSDDYYIHKKVIDTLGNIIDFNRFMEENLVEDKAEIGQFIFANYLKKATAPFSFERELIYHVINDNPSEDNVHWGVSLKDYQSVMQNYFNTYLDSLSASTWEVYRLYHKVYDIGVVEPTNLKLKTFLKETDYKQFLADIIDKDAFNKVYNISSIILKIFEYYNAFTEFLNELPDSEELKEFKVFNELLSYHEYNSQIYFDFKHINLRFKDDRRFDSDPRKELYIKVEHQGLFDKIEKDSVNIISKFNQLHIQVLKFNCIVIRDRSGQKDAGFKKDVIHLFENTALEISINLKRDDSADGVFKRGITLFRHDEENAVEIKWYQIKS
ncbi:MAG: P-loop NTPase fold protein [Reichenbachiella sp.]|uniref:KAP family P-loop NTPase fold protein n=1 Tax=Reichenbachiella sp. TaxID=2184521 RepID=UPI003265988B